jgi:hypothetical protein
VWIDKMEKDKVIEIFRELVGEKAENLSGSFYPAYANSKITNALIKDRPDLSEDEIIDADSIGMDLVCWQRNAAFIVALTLFPEKFTDDEIEDEVVSLLLHMPDHIQNALKGYDKLTTEIT